MKCLALLLLMLLPLSAAEKLPSYKQLSALTNPQKLAGLKQGNRSGNARFKKLMYWINQYEQQGTLPKEFLAKLYREHSGTQSYQSTRHVYAPATEKLNLEAQYRLGRAYGLYTDDNLLKLRKGNAAIVTRGQYQGEKIEIDHLIPYSKAPELENSMANLTWLPRSLNRSKSAKVTNAALRRAKALQLEVGWVWNPHS